ncbi:MAG: sulfofructose kinase [Paracoccaceae bacterium]|jgi:sulfofructose kinase
MAHVFVTGLAALDFVFQMDDLPTGGEKYQAQDVAIVGGGGAANAAVAVARLGGQASLAAQIGDDAVGDMILADLRVEGVALDPIHQTAAAMSAFSSIYVARNGDRQIVNFRGAGLDETPPFQNIPASVDVVLADTRWVTGAQNALDIAKARGIPGILDAEAPVSPGLVNAASHIAFSRQGLTDWTGEADMITAIKAVMGQTSAWVCVTDGASGVYFGVGNTIENIPAFAVTAIDTLAAGDVWHGAFCLRLAEGCPEPEAMIFANAAAALKCTQFGGRQGCPDRRATEAFLQSPPPTR